MRRVFHLQLQQKVHQSFKHKFIYKPSLLAVSINSHGGSLVKAKAIRNFLRQFCLEKKIKMLTFGEDVVMNSANVLLFSGDKVFCNKYSLIGDWGYTYRSLGLKEFISNKNFEIGFTTGGKDKVKINPFEDLQEKDVKWVKNVLEINTKELLQQVYDSRKKNLSEKNIELKLLETSIFNNTLNNPKKLLDKGLIDEIITLQNLLARDYPKNKVANIIKKNPFSDSPVHTESLENFGILQFYDDIGEVV